MWGYSGLLPGNKGVAGVTWRDLDEAVLEQSFRSGLLRPSKVRSGHRHSKASEIYPTHMSNRHESVMAIDARHQPLVRAHGLG